MAASHVISVLCLLVVSVHACSQPEGWKTRPMMDRAYEADLIIYGRIRSISEEPRDSMYTDIEYVLDVYCVIYNSMQSEIQGNITVHETYPPGECVSNKHSMEEDKKVILMLRDEMGRYKFDNINVQGAVFDGNEENLKEIAGDCKMQNLYSPDDAATKECPATSLGTVCRSGATTNNAYTLLFLSLIIFTYLKLF